MSAYITKLDILGFNATEIDAPRYNASMQLVGKSITGWI